MEGEIWVSYINFIVFGYWEWLVESKDIFDNYIVIGDGFYFCIGDLGFLMDGELFIIGWEKDLIIIWGVNYYLDDIEEVVEYVYFVFQDNGCVVFVIEKLGCECFVFVQEVCCIEWCNVDEQEVVDVICQVVSEVFEIQFYVIVLIWLMSLLKILSGKV